MAKIYFKTYYPVVMCSFKNNSLRVRQELCHLFHLHYYNLSTQQVLNKIPE